MEKELNSSDAEQVERMRSQEANAEERLIADFKEVLETRAGRNVIAHVFDLSKPHAQSFTGNSTTFFNEGKRSVGIPIFDMIMTHFPELYLTLSKETKGLSNE